MTALSLGRHPFAMLVVTRVCHNQQRQQDEGKDARTARAMTLAHCQ